MPPYSLLQRKLLIFTGKGGVGKSTVTAAFAVAAARRGKRVLLLEIGEHEKFSRLFNVPVVGYKGGVVYSPRAANAPPITAMCLTATEALREYGMRTVKFSMLYDAIFDNPVVRYFTAAAPGLVELNLLGKIESLHREVMPPAAGARFDLMLLDAPSTGHALALFQAPQMARRLAQAGPVYAMVDRMWQFITDPARTALNIVTLPEEMPINESIELDAAASELGMPRGAVIVNGMYPNVFGDDEPALEQLRPANGFAQTVIAAARSTVARRHEQDALAARLDAIPMARIELPWIITPRMGAGEIEVLADRIAPLTNV